MSTGLSTNRRKRSYQEVSVDDAGSRSTAPDSSERESTVTDAMNARQEAHRWEMASKMDGNRHVDQAALLQTAQIEDEAPGTSAAMMLAAEALQRQMEENAAIEAQVEQYTAQLLEEAAMEEDMLTDT